MSKSCPSIQPPPHSGQWGASGDECDSQKGQNSRYNKDLLDSQSLLLPTLPSPLRRYPVTVVHDILGESSPISSWATHEGKRLDADCEIVVTVKVET